MIRKILTVQRLSLEIARGIRQFKRFAESATECHTRHKQHTQKPSQQILDTHVQINISPFLCVSIFWWIYDFPVFVYDEMKRPRVWTPDFFIPKLGMYIEVCGSEDFDYECGKKAYRKNGYHVIFVHLYKEKKKWKNYLIKRIMEIEEQRHDEVMKMLHSLRF